MMSVDQRLTKRDRLVEGGRIRAVRLRGERCRVKPIVVARSPNDQKTPRMALAFGRRAGASVVRNHAKRRIREFFRKNKEIMGSYDYVFYASHDLTSLSGLDWKGIAEVILKWCKERVW